MKMLLLLILSVSCATRVEQRKESTLKDFLSADEKVIYSCLEEAKYSPDMRSKCLEGTPYSGAARSPSASSREIIASNSWFFESDANKLNYFKIMKSIVKLKEKMVKKAGGALDEMGIGVSGEAFAGLGVKWSAELIIHREKLGLFCAPGILLTNEVGVEAGVELVKSLSCPSSHAYEGGFLTVGAGVSAEALMLPFGLKVAYSLGVDGKKFLAQYNSHKKKGTIDFADMAIEITSLSLMAPHKLLSQANGSLDAAFLNIGLRMVRNLMQDQDPNLKYKLKTKHTETALKEALKKNKSLGEWIKTSQSSARLATFLKDNKLPQLALFFKILSTSLTGCDSIGGAAALSLSVSPVSLGLSFTKYSLLFETPVETLNTLAKLSPLALLQLNLLDAKDAAIIVRTARDLLQVPEKVINHCGTKDFFKF